MWRKNGVVLDGENGDSLTIVWEKRRRANSVDSYTVTAMFASGEDEVEGDTAEFTVEHQPHGAVMFIR